MQQSTKTPWGNNPNRIGHRPAKLAKTVESARKTSIADLYMDQSGNLIGNP